MPNSVYALLGDDNAFSVFNFNGNTHVLADVVGTFYLRSESIGGIARGTTQPGHPVTTAHSVGVDPPHRAP